MSGNLKKKGKDVLPSNDVEAEGGLLDGVAQDQELIDMKPKRKRKGAPNDPPNTIGGAF
jgi:hypothetical protein